MLEPLPLPKARLEALTDGIFAVTMTLLVLDLKFEDRVTGDPDQVFAQLLGLLPYVDDYVISFVVLCVFWLAHLRLIRRMREADPVFAWINLAFLLFTTFVPPLTSWLGHRAGQPAPAVVYGVNLILILTCEAMMWHRACHHLLNESVQDGPALWRSLRGRFLFAAAVIVAGVVAALVEIGVGKQVSYASYVYLLLIAAGLVRPHISAPLPALGISEDPDP